MTSEQKAFNVHLAHYRMVEHTIAQISRFQQVFRQMRTSHTRIMRIVCALVNRKIARKPLKTCATL